MPQIEVYGRPGTFILVDEDDFDELSKYNWTLNHKGYAIATVLNQSISMHRAILPPKEIRGKYVDHINRNRLDNRKENLRVCSASDNMKNRAKFTAREYSSQYKGVSWSSRDGRWQVAITRDKKIHMAGSFEDEAYAARVYNSWAKHLHGEYACYNQVTPMFADIDVASKLSLREKGVREDNVCGFRGVNYCAKKKKWRSYYNVEGRQYFVGYFLTPEEAYAARVKKLEAHSSGNVPDKKWNLVVPCFGCQFVAAHKHREVYTPQGQAVILPLCVECKSGSGNFKFPDLSSLSNPEEFVRQICAWKSAGYSFNWMARFLTALGYTRPGWKKVYDVLLKKMYDEAILVF